MDVDAIPFGKNFVKILQEEDAKCDALLAVIGPAWLDMRDEDGNRRLDDSNDFGGGALRPSPSLAWSWQEHACAAGVVERVGR
jgi:hypothetical protein